MNKQNQKNSSSKNQLLPCPFCGNKADFAGGGESRWIRCWNDRCGAMLIGPDYTYKSSIDSWNDRRNPK